MHNNYLRSTFLFPPLKPICCAVDKAPKPQKQKTERQLPSLRIWYLLNMRSRCEFQFHASGDYSIFWHFCTKKTYDKTEKNNSQNIDNKLKRFSFSSWMTIAVPFFSNFVAVVVIVNFGVRLSTHNWQHFFLVSRHESLPLSNFLLSLVIFVCKWSLPLPPLLLLVSVCLLKIGLGWSLRWPLRKCVVLAI